MIDARRSRRQEIRMFDYLGGKIGLLDLLNLQLNRYHIYIYIFFFFQISFSEHKHQSGPITLETG